MTATVFTAKVAGTMSIGLWAGYNASLVHSPCGELNTNAIGSNCCAGLSKLRLIVTALLHGKCPPCGSCNSDKSEKDTSESHDQNQSATQKSALSIRRVLEYSISAAQASTLSAVTLISNFAAYALSTRSGKHPYLIYLALGAPLVGILQYYGSRELRSQISSKSSSHHARTGSDEVLPLEEDIDEDISDLGASAYEHVSSSPGSSRASLDKSEFGLSHKYSIYSSVVAGLSGFLFAISVIGLAGESS